MTFNSYTFILAFLPAVTLVYYVIASRPQPKYKSFFLLLVSIVFYGFSNTSSLILIAIGIITNYIVYLCIQNNQPKNRLTKKIFLIIGITINLTALLYFKYCNFFIDNINTLFKTDLEIRNIALPLGISFITFQQIAFLIDAYRKEMPEYDLLEYALFVLFFPHIISGPIILHRDFMPLLSEGKKKIDWGRIASGIYMFAIGLGKKTLIADIFARAANWGYGNITALNSTSALFVSIAYSIQIYFDFSGYSDMAIGISRIFQMALPINFNSPYKATNILEFWDRWHITLTRFLSKYLYIPLGGNRKGKARTYLNTMIVFLCSGLWHGASWTFILWGALHGVALILTKHFKKFIDRIPSAINRTITFLFVNFCWILFRANNISDFKQMVDRILQGGWGGLDKDLCGLFKIPILYYFPGLALPYWLCAAIFLIGAAWILLCCQNTKEKAEHLKYSTISCIWVATVAVLSILSLSNVSTYVYAYF